MYLYSAGGDLQLDNLSAQYIPVAPIARPLYTWYQGSHCF